MEREERFEHGGQICWRRELENSPVVIQKKTEKRYYYGKEYTVISTRWKGHHKIKMPFELVEAEESVVVDAGQKLGVSVSFVRHPETATTSEDQAENRALICKRIGEIFQCACSWKEKEEITDACSGAKM